MPNSCRQHPAQAPLPISTAGSSPLESKINPAERHSAYPVPAASPAAAASPADACAGISLPSGAAGADASGRHSVQRDRRLPWLQIFEPQHSLHITFYLPWLQNAEPPHSLQYRFCLQWLHISLSFLGFLGLSFLAF